MMNYAEQLKHPNWQRKRLEVLDAARFRCQRCGDADRTLHVHHRGYVKGRKAWEYERHELVSLCESCHAVAHEERALLDAEIAGVDLRAIPALCKFIRLAQVDDVPWDRLADALSMLGAEIFMDAIVEAVEKDLA